MEDMCSTLKGDSKRLEQQVQHHDRVRSELGSRAYSVLQGSAGAEEGFDLVHLCSVFASDPFVMAFAKLVESGTRNSQAGTCS